mgnify:CR=1 FL=1
MLKIADFHRNPKGQWLNLSISGVKNLEIGTAITAIFYLLLEQILPSAKCIYTRLVGYRSGYISIKLVESQHCREYYPTHADFSNSPIYKE